MTPAARLSAAIEILDFYLGCEAVEKALTNWARRSRFAGSKDRAAVRDIVFDCVRQRESLMALGGGRSGRALVTGYCFATVGLDGTVDLFTGEGHAPPALSDAERDAIAKQPATSPQAQYDLPDWLIARFEATLGDAALPVAQTLKSRAPVFLRVNLSRISRDAAAQTLAQDGVATEPHDTVPTALVVTENPRKVAASRAYAEGLIELQDASSQAACLSLPPAKRMLDYCAGGGGKVLAYGDAHRADLFAHDANSARLRDLPERARRAGAKVRLLDTADCRKQAPFDLVLMDVPCSGSGTWRRAPEGKWALTPEKLQGLCAQQASIMDAAAKLVGVDGCLAYATCSVLHEENEAQVQAFADRNPGFTVDHEKRYQPNMQGDGFFLAHLTRV